MTIPEQEILSVKNIYTIVSADLNEFLKIKPGIAIKSAHLKLLYWFICISDIMLGKIDASATLKALDTFNPKMLINNTFSPFPILQVPIG